MDEQLLSRIEDAGLNASAPPQQRWIDGWIVRYCPGKARRSRCINAVAAGRLPLARRLALARAVYDAAGLPMVLRLTRFTQPPELDAQLAEQGYPRQDETLVQVMTLDGRTELAAPPRGVHWGQLDAGAFAETVGALRGTPSDQRQAHAQRLRQSPVPYSAHVIRRDSDGQVLACGQFAREGDLVGLYDIFTHPDARSHGLAGLLCGRMLSLSSLQGAGIAYLQVESTNAAALRLYARLGFVQGYSYHYREPPEG